MLRIIIFEDNLLHLEGLQMLINEQPDMLVVGAYREATSAVKRILQTKPDVVLMDIKMPNLSGIVAVREIKKKFPELQILMQTVFEDDHKVFAAICAGASGYILKGIPHQKLIQAINEVANGGSPMSPPIARKVFSHFQEKSMQNIDYQALTPREKDILKHLVDGLSYKLIADATDLTLNTVNGHLKKIYAKLHVNSSLEAVTKALQHKIFSFF